MADLYETLGSKRKPGNMPYFWSVSERSGFVEELIAFLNDDKQNQKNISRGARYDDKPINVNFLKIKRTSAITGQQQLAVLGYPDDRNEKHPIAREYMLIGIWDKSKQKLIPCIDLEEFFRSEEVDSIIKKCDDAPFVDALNNAKSKLRKMVEEFNPDDYSGDVEIDRASIISEVALGYRRGPLNTIEEQFNFFVERRISSAFIPDIYEAQKEFVESLFDDFLSDSQKITRIIAVQKKYEQLVNEMKDNLPPDVATLKSIRDAIPKGVYNFNIEVDGVKGSVMFGVDVRALFMYADARVHLSFITPRKKIKEVISAIGSVEDKDYRGGYCIPIASVRKVIYRRKVVYDRDKIGRPENQDQNA